MTEFITRVCHGGRRYEVIIKTDNEGNYKAAEKFARSLIGHEKPQTNADRIRATRYCPNCGAKMEGRNGEG